MDFQVLKSQGSMALLYPELFYSSPNHHSLKIHFTTSAYGINLQNGWQNDKDPQMSTIMTLIIITENFNYTI
jgi:hypothetical protein